MHVLIKGASRVLHNIRVPVLTHDEAAETIITWEHLFMIILMHPERKQNIWLSR